MAGHAPKDETHLWPRSIVAALAVEPAVLAVFALWWEIHHSMPSPNITYALLSLNALALGPRSTQEGRSDPDTFGVDTARSSRRCTGRLTALHESPRATRAPGSADHRRRECAGLVSPTRPLPRGRPIDHSPRVFELVPPRVLETRSPPSEGGVLSIERWQLVDPAYRYLLWDPSLRASHDLTASGAVR